MKERISKSIFFMKECRKMQTECLCMLNLKMGETFCFFMRVNEKFDVVGYTKDKSTLIKGNYTLQELGSLVEKINDCEMLTIKFSKDSKRQIVEFFRCYCIEKSCYAPIVFLDKEEVLFFPKLRYQDSYLLEYMLETQFYKELYHIYYVNKDDLVIFR